MLLYIHTTLKSVSESDDLPPLSKELAPISPSSDACASVARPLRVVGNVPTSSPLNLNKKQKTLLKDEVLEYGEEDTIDYILFIIREGTGKLY